MLRRSLLFFVIATSLTALAQNPPEAQAPAAAEQPPSTLKQRTEPPPSSDTVSVPNGTHVLLNMINSVSTKQAQVGDRLYLETAFPVLSGNRIVVPQGSWVTGTITYVKRPARVKGRGELQVRFDSLTLPNGVTRNFRGDLSALDGRSDQDINREQSKVKGPSDKTGDVTTVATTTIAGAGIGGLAGISQGASGKGTLIGAGAGAAAGMAAVLLSRGPEATLLKGSSVEMVLDRSLTFQRDELDFSGAPPRATLSEGSQTAAPQRKTFGSRFPL